LSYDVDENQEDTYRNIKPAATTIKKDTIEVSGAKKSLNRVSSNNKKRHQPNQGQNNLNAQNRNGNHLSFSGGNV